MNLLSRVRSIQERTRIVEFTNQRWFSIMDPSYELIQKERDLVRDTTRCELDHLRYSSCRQLCLLPGVPFDDQGLFKIRKVLKQNIKDLHVARDYELKQVRDVIFARKRKQRAIQ